MSDFRCSASCFCHVRPASVSWAASTGRPLACSQDSPLQAEHLVALGCPMGGCNVRLTVSMVSGGPCCDNEGASSATLAASCAMHLHDDGTTKQQHHLSCTCNHAHLHQVVQQYSCHMRPLHRLTQVWRQSLGTLGQARTQGVHAHAWPDCGHHHTITRYSSHKAIAWEPT
jgi:hypothetical protein